MDLLLDALSRCRPGSLDTVIHIGVGPAGHGEHAGLDARRWVLVEGDPDNFAALEATVRQCAPAVQALQAVVMPQAGPAVWHRCSLRRWNGPRSTEPLLVHYPRLQIIEPLTLEAVSLHELLSSLDVPEFDSAANALILDLPGQEAALLASVSAESLRRFEWIALRGAARGHGPGWGTLADAEAVLRGHGFESVPALGDLDDPLWPVALLRLDRSRHRLAQLQQALDAQQRRADTAEQALTRLQDQHHQDVAALNREREPLQAALDSARADHQACLKDLNQERQRAASLDHEVGRATAALAEATRDLDTLRPQAEVLQRRVHELEPLHAAATDRIDRLTRELATLTDRYDAGQGELRKAQAAAAERDAAREFAQQLQARVTAAEARQAGAEAQQSSVEVALQQERQRAASLEHELDRATAQVAEITRELAALTDRYEAGQGELKEQSSLAQAALAERDAARELAQQLQARVAAAEARQSRAEAQLSSLEIEMAAIGNRLTTAQAEIGTQTSQQAAPADHELAQQMEAREAVADARQSSAHLQLNALHAEVAALETQLTMVRAELGTQTSQAQAALTERDAARELAQQIEARAAAAEARQCTAEAQLEAARAELAALERRLATAQAETAQALQGGRDTIARLEDEAAQLRLRQRLMDDEIVKAEGQIELIKDVLLREPGL